MTLAGVMELGAGCVLAVLPPLAMLAQEGAVREGKGCQGEISCWVPACQIDRPTTREGEAGRQGGVVIWQTRADPSTLLVGEGWGLEGRSGSARQIYGSILLQTAYNKSTQAQRQFSRKLIL
jgi:hypothetical protein